MAALRLNYSINNIRNALDKWINLIARDFCPNLEDRVAQLGLGRRTWLEITESSLQDVPDGFNGRNIWRSRWMGENGDVSLGKPFLCDLCAMRWCAVLLKPKIGLGTLDACIEVDEDTLEHLFDVAGSSHTPSLPSGVLQNHKRPFHTFHDDSPYYKAHRTLGHCRDAALVQILLPSLSSHPDLAFLVVKADISLI